MLQTKTFTAGMDSDTSDELMSPGFDRYRLNTRILSNQDGNIGNAVTTNGNSPLSPPFLLPIGDNKVIGSVEDPLRKMVYYFVWNSNDLHLIMEYNSVTGGVEIVFQDGIASNTPNILNFDKDHLITGINVIKLTDEAHLLYWTDAYNEPRKINIEKGKLYISSGGTDPNGYINSIAPFNSDETLYFDPRILYRIKQPPLNCPDYVWEGEVSTPILQFNATFSVLEPPYLPEFDLECPTGIETVPFNYDPNSPLDNYDLGTYQWTVPVNGYYSMLTSITQGLSSVGMLPTVLSINIVSSGVLQSISSTTNGIVTLSIPTVFLNAGDVLYVTIENPSPQILDPYGQPTVYLYYTPINFTASLITATNELIVNHLFKKLFQFKTQFVYDDYEVSAWSPISKFVFPDTLKDINKPDDIYLQNDIIKITIPTGSSIVKKIRIAAKEVASSDFSLIAEIDKTDYLLKDNSTYIYTFLNEGNYVPLEVNESIKLFDNVPKLSKSQDLIFGNRLVDGLITEGYDNVNIDLRLPIAYDNVVLSSFNNHFPKNSYLKSGGIYQFGIVYYDMPGNRSGVANVVNSKTTVLQPNNVYGTKMYIPFLTQINYDSAFASDKVMERVPKIVSEIYNTPPSWATHYQIVRSKNLAITKYIQFVADATPIYTAGTTNTVSIVIKNIYSPTAPSYKVSYPNSTLVYDFTKGDRIRFIANRLSSTTISNKFDYNDTEILSFDSGTGVLKIRNFASVPLAMTAGVLFEIYTPSLQVINDNELMYETCEEGKIALDSNNNLIHQGDFNQAIYQSTASTLDSPSAGFILLDVSTVTASSILAEQTLRGGTITTKVNGNGWSVYGALTWVSTTTVKIEYSTNGIIGTYTPSISIIILAANIELTSGDCFRRIQNNIYSAGELNIYVEAMNASNMFASQAWDYGRPNRIDKNNREITRPSTVIYSEQLVPETFINGLSSVFDTNFETYENKYGGIQKMYAKDQRLILFQELKVGAIPVSQNVFAGTQGGSVVGTSTQILSPTAQYYSGEFGIGKNPESFAVYANSIYFLDMLRCTPIRLGQDGLISLAETGKMNDYFIKKCSTALVLPFQLKVYGVFDVEFGEYIISFENVPTVYQGETVAFDEGNNIFSSFYSYLPENMCSNSGGIVTFKNGNLWTHNSNNTQNNFYGNQYTSDIWMVLNENPMNVKIFTAIEEDSKDVWEVPSISNDEGQESNLIKSDFKQTNVAGVYGIEGQQYAPVWKDANTPNVPLGTGLFQGDPMRSRAFRIKLKYSGTDKSKLFSVNLRYIISNLHAR